MNHFRRVPHETAPQRALHTLWPAAHDLWEDDLEPARAEFAAFLRLAAAPGADGRALPLIVYAAGEEAERSAEAALGAAAKIVRAPYGDVWARDTGPVFVLGENGLEAVRFRFNGWGGKYQLPGDETIGVVIAAEASVPEVSCDLICEGGALEFDGEGTLITTRQCVLNSNRNPGLDEARAEAVFAQKLGVKKTIWLDEGLAGDHTDGHVDNIARFIAPGVAACQTPSGRNDPNAAVLDSIARQLESATDARGRRLKVVRIPSPGFVVGENGGPAAASHMNWVAGPRHVVIPAYNDYAQDAARALQPHFSWRKVIVSASGAILTGGGSFHCVTCNEPEQD